MKLRPPSRVWFARAALCAAAVVLPVSATPASAAPVSIDLNYTCTFPLLKPSPVKLHVTSDIPSTVSLGKPTGAFALQATARVSAGAAFGLRAVDATTIEGTAIAVTDVIKPNGSVLPAKVPTTITKRDIPDNQDFDTQATGATPSLTFSDVGQAKINIKDLILTLTPRLADGTLTGLDTFETECSQDPGQNNTFATINVIDGSPTPTPQPTNSTNWSLGGQIAMKTLAQGIVPLTGSATTTVDKTTGATTGNVTIDPARGSLKALNLLPVKASFVFSEDGGSTGTLASNTLALTTKQNIRLTNVSVFGVNLVAGTCHTSTPSTLALTSTAGTFNPATGGTARSIFSIAKFTDCGSLGVIVSGLAAGGGNAVSLTFSPKTGA